MNTAVLHILWQHSSERFCALSLSRSRTPSSALSILDGGAGWSLEDGRGRTRIEQTRECDTRRQTRQASRPRGIRLNGRPTGGGRRGQGLPDHSLTDDRRMDGRTDGQTDRQQGPCHSTPRLRPDERQRRRITSVLTRWLPCRWHGRGLAVGQSRPQPVSLSALCGPQVIHA